MNKLLILVVGLSLNTSLWASSLHKGWQVGSCTQIDKQLDLETSGLWADFFGSFHSHKNLLQTATEDAVAQADLSDGKLNLEKDYEKLSRDLERGAVSYLKDRYCRGGEYVFRGQRSYDGKPGFSMVRLECSPSGLAAKKQKLSFGFLAVVAGTKTEKRLFNDGKDHVLVRSCLRARELVKRGNRTRSWLKVDGELCVAYDLASDKWYSYETHKLTKGLDEKALRYNLSYSITHYDLNRVLTPGGVTASSDVTPLSRESLEGVYADLFTPNKCRSEGKPAYHDDYYLQLVPAPKVECAWYDVVCRALN